MTVSRQSPTVEVLARTRLFAGVDASALTALAQRFTSRRCRRGEVVVRQGDPGDSLYVVASGSLKVLVESAAGEEMVLVTLGTSETFGELALVDGGPRSATVEALEPSELLVLTRQNFFDLAREQPAMIQGLLDNFGGLLRRLTDQLADMVFLDLSGRLAKLLLGLAAQGGSQPGQQSVLELTFNQTEIAHMVGGSRQSVNQILGALESAGYIETSGHTVRILRLDALRRRAGFS